MIALHISEMKPGNHRNEGREGGRGGEGEREGGREEGWSE